MADQQAPATYDTGAGHDSYARDPRPRTGKSLPSKMVDSVAKHPAAALGIIIVLIVVLLYFLAKSKGWFGLGGGKAPMRGGRASSGKKARAAKGGGDDEEDPETEDLIDSINGSGR
mgnify:CR=1 FL=1